MSALNWYQALAMWKAAVFMEGNYKRYTMGASDDEYLALFDEGVPRWQRRRARSRWRDEGAAGRLRRRAHHQRVRLLSRLLREEGLDPDADEAPVPRRAARARGRARARDRRPERGRVRRALRRAARARRRPAGRDGRPHVRPHASPTRRCSTRVRRARAGGIRTGLISNSMGAGRYDRASLRRAVRRRGDLRRGGHAQAPAGDLPAGRRAGRARRPRSACSWTTCARTATAPRPWG